MRATDKQLLVNALLGGIPERSMPEPLTQMCMEEVDMIEPVVDQMIKDAESRGMFEAFLHLAVLQGQRLENLRRV